MDAVHTISCYEKAQDILGTPHCCGHRRRLTFSMHNNAPVPRMGGGEDSAGIAEFYISADLRPDDQEDAYENRLPERSRPAVGARYTMT